MKTLVAVKKLTGALLAGAALMLFANAANALTASGTSISNSATVNYSVNSVSQSAITSTAVTFKVDTELLLTVAKVDSSRQNVTPGQNGVTTPAVLTYTVTNSGNSTEDVSLSAIANASGFTDPFGSTSSFQGTAGTPFVESGGTAGYQSAQDTANAISNLAAGSSMTVYVVLNSNPAISATQTDGQTAVYGLVATVSVAGSCNASGSTCTAETQDTSTNKNTNLTSVLKVFADTTAGPDDSARDGKSSASDTFIVKSAQLSISKTATVVSDPVNGSTTPRAIPGAVMQYSILVANASGATQSATGVSITDSLASQIGSTTTWKSGQLNVAFYGNTTGTGSPTSTVGPCADTGATVTTSGGVSCDYNITTANTVTVGGITLAAGTSAVVTYQVTIN